MDVYLDPGALAEQLAADVRAGLTATPKTLPPKYFYDAHGSELFDRITRLPEYYPTRTERAILAAHAAEIAAATRAESLVELGSGTSEKTRLLLRALRAAGTLRALRALRRRPGRAQGRERGGGRRVPRHRRASRSSATSSSTSASCRVARAGCSPSSARRSATSTRPSAPASSPTCARRWRRATRSCSAPTW